MIRMFGVSKIYRNGIKALSDINFHIKKGEFVFIVGPSGAGKSTLIKLIFREELPSSGQVIVAGRNVARLRRKDLPFFRRKIGVVFQDFRLLPDKTVFENVSFAMEVVEASKSEIRRRVPEVLELVGLRGKEKSMPSELSGGEQQRVSLARAIVNNPEIVVADEPTGNLDPETSWDIIKLLQQINLRGTTVVVATHESSIVNMLRKRVIAIEKGRIVRDQQKGVYNYES
ncbi:MAG: cell division transport system ATP-binding protein [Thermosediminibacterales bacterium]|nr:cell division transport system ATP-binding protein [Thermosediminibacterales bacterium]MDK2836165.1 cell division transport system ATP-binding protein [Thermosediminibacterales bacterium]